MLLDLGIDKNSVVLALEVRRELRGWSKLHEYLEHVQGKRMALIIYIYILKRYSHP